MFLIQNRPEFHGMTKDGEEKPPVFLKSQKFLMEIFY